MRGERQDVDFPVAEKNDVIWNPPTTSSTRPGGVSGALWASKPLCSPTSPPMAGEHDPFLIPPIKENLGVLLRTCVRGSRLSLYART